MLLFARTHTHVTHTRTNYNNNNKTSCVSHLVDESDQYDSLMILENRTRRVTLNWHASKYKVHYDGSVGYNVLRCARYKNSTRGISHNRGWKNSTRGTSHSRGRKNLLLFDTIEAGRTLPEVLHTAEAGKTYYCLSTNKKLLVS